MRVLPALAAALSLLTLAQVALADPAVALSEGDRAMEGLDYTVAIAAFERAAADRDAQAQDLVRAFSALVRCQVVLGNQVSARAAAEQLLDVDPGAELTGSNIPPRVTRFFDAFKRSYRPSLAVSVTAEPEAAVVPGAPWGVSARINRGRRAVAALRLYLRLGRAPEETRAMLRRTDRTWWARVELPRDFRPEASDLYYWIEALSVSGAVIGSLGSSDEPMIVAPMLEEPADPPSPRAGTHERVVPIVEPSPVTRHTGRSSGPALTSRWWFWTAVGAVLVGGAVTTLVVTDTAEPARHGEDGDVQLP